MSFRKKKEICTLPMDVEEKTVKVYYIYKTVMEDEIDEELLYKKAFSYIDENEEYDTICFRDNIWFGISQNCLTCIYIDFDEEQGMDPTSAYKLVDSRIWRLNTGFTFRDNNYKKIIITSTKSPESMFTDNKRWQNILKSFDVIKLD